MVNIFGIMKGSRMLAGLLRKNLIQSRGLVAAAAASPSAPQLCQKAPEISPPAHKRQWSSCERPQILYESRFQNFAPKSSLFSSVASPELSGKDTNPDSSVEDSVVANGDVKAEPVSPKQSDSAGKNNAVNGGKTQPNKTAQRKETYSDEDEDEENEFSTDELLKFIRQKEELLKEKNKEIEKMQEKVLRSYAEVENVTDRTRREAENSKKFAIQSFAKSLLDVADNLGRASSVVKENFSKTDSSKDTDKVVPLLKTLLEGVEMTEKQLSEVFKKYGIERFDPINEHFDPNLHMAVFQVPDATKQPGTVAVVLKSGYTLHDRVIRPAEVGVVENVQGEAGGSPGQST